MLPTSAKKTMKMWSRKPAKRLTAAPYFGSAKPVTARRFRYSLAWWMSAAIFAASALPGNSFAAPADNRHVSVDRILGGTAAKASSKKEGVRELREGDQLTEGTLVETGERTIVKLGFFDGSVITVGQNTRLNLTDMRGDEKAMIRWDLKLESGAVRGAISERDTQKPKEMRGIKLSIDSPIAAMGVRGTKFIYAHERTMAGQERTEVRTESGEVLFATDASFPKDMTVEVTGGHWAFIEKNQKKPGPPQKINNERELRDVLEKHGFTLDERAPASWNQDPNAGTTKAVDPAACIERKLGWRQNSGSNATIGDCYP